MLGSYGVKLCSAPKPSHSNLGLSSSLIACGALNLACRLDDGAQISTAHIASAPAPVLRISCLHLAQSRELTVHSAVGTWTVASAWVLGMPLLWTSMIHASCSRSGLRNWLVMRIAGLPQLLKLGLHTVYFVTRNETKKKDHGAHASLHVYATCHMHMPQAHNYHSRGCTTTTVVLYPSEYVAACQLRMHVAKHVHLCVSM